MKRLSLILAASAAAIAFGACNKHSWDQEINGQIPTKKIFEPHGDHGHDEGHGGKEGEAPHSDKATGESADH